MTKIIFLLLVCTFGFAQETTTQNQPNNPDCDNPDANNPLDPCHRMRELNNEQAKAEAISAGVYGLATAVCTLECFYPLSGGTACHVGVAAGVASDVLGVVMVSEKAKVAMDKFKSTLPVVGLVGAAKITGLVGFEKEGFYGNEKYFDKQGKELTKKPDGNYYDKSGKKYEVDKTKKQDGNKQACTEAITAGAMATFRFISYKQAKARAEQRTPQEAVTHTAIQASSSNLPTSGVGPRATQAEAQARTGSLESEVADSSGEKLASSAAEAGFGQALKNFEDFTGKPSSELFDRILAGENPVAAATSMAGSKLGGEAGSWAAGLAQNTQALEEALSEEAKAALAQNTDAGFTGSGGSNARSPAQGDDMGLSAITEMMAGLLPKKDSKEGPKGPQALQFSRQPQATSEGFHPPTRSLFEIVDSRYQKLSFDFLAGKTSPSSPGMPSNPYLKK